MAAIDKVRIIVAGDSGVGKTSLVHLISNNEVMKSPSWTIGCSVEVKLHEYKEGTPSQKTYFLELWDLGGSTAHRNVRSVFYNPTHGIILVHDLINRKSEHNLQKWLSEILNIDNSRTGKGFIQQPSDDIDPESFLGSTRIPILVIGTKQDLVTDEKLKNQRRRSVIAEQCRCDEIYVDCKDARSLAAGSSNAVVLSRFFDKVIERRYYSRNTSPFTDKRKYIPGSPALTNTNLLSPKFYHMD